MYLDTPSYWQGLSRKISTVNFVDFVFPWGMLWGHPHAQLGGIALLWHSWNFTYARDLSGRGSTRAEDAQGTPTQSHISPNIQVNEDSGEASDAPLVLV